MFFLNLCKVTGSVHSLGHSKWTVTSTQDFLTTMPIEMRGCAQIWFIPNGLLLCIPIKKKGKKSFLKLNLDSFKI